MTAKPRQARDRWIFAGLLLLLAWLPLPFGSNTVAATSLFTVAVASLVLWRLGLAVAGVEVPRLPAAARAVMVFFIFWALWLALHALPLPPQALSALSPSAHAIHAGVAALEHGEPAWTLSIAPGESLRQLSLTISYLGLFWLTLATTAGNRRRQRWVLLLIVGSAVAQATYGSVMALSDMEYGFLGPKTFGHDRATGTFVNQNHLAGYLELGIAAAIGLILSDLRPARPLERRAFLSGLIELAMSRRMRIRIILALMVVTLVLTRSRGGNAAFLLALALCGGTFLLVRHPKYLGKSLIFFLSVVTVDLLVISEQYGLDQLSHRIQDTRLDTEQRALALRDLQPLLGQYWLTGSGPGSFGVAFAPHRSADLAGYFDHAHNDHLESFIETGIIGYCLLAVIAVTSLAHALAIVRRRRDPMAAGLAFASSMGLTSLMIHGLVDFNLRIPATAATLLALVALSLSCRSSARSGTSTVAAVPGGPRAPGTEATVAVN